MSHIPCYTCTGLREAKNEVVIFLVRECIHHLSNSLKLSSDV